MPNPFQIMCFIVLLMMSGCYHSSSSGIDTESGSTGTPTMPGQATDSDSSASSTANTTLASDVPIDTVSANYPDSNNTRVDTGSAASDTQPDSATAPADANPTDISQDTSIDTSNIVIDTFAGTFGTGETADTTHHTEDSLSDSGDSASATDDCYPGDFVVSNALDLSSIADYPCIAGDLDISGTALTTVSLPKLQTVHGAITILTNPNLSVLDFSSLNRIKRNLSIAQTGALVSLDGFTNLLQVDGELIISANPLLESAVRLISLNHVGERVIVNGNQSLKEFASPALATVGGTMIFAGNDLLQTLRFPALQASGGIEFNGLESIVEISLPQLKNVSGHISVCGCPVIERVLMPEMVSATEGISVSGNSSHSVGFHTIDFGELTDTTYIAISGNYLLTSLNMGSLTTGSLSPTPESGVSITYNELLPYCQLCTVFSNEELTAKGTVDANQADDCCPTGECTNATELICP